MKNTILNLFNKTKTFHKTVIILLTFIIICITISPQIRQQNQSYIDETNPQITKLYEESENNYRKILGQDFNKTFFNRTNIFRKSYLDETDWVSAPRQFTLRNFNINDQVTEFSFNHFTLIYTYPSYLINKYLGIKLNEQYIALIILFALINAYIICELLYFLYKIMKSKILIIILWLSNILNFNLMFYFTNIYWVGFVYPLLFLLTLKYLNKDDKLNAKKYYTLSVITFIFSFLTHNEYFIVPFICWCLPYLFYIKANDVVGFIKKMYRRIILFVLIFIGLYLFSFIFAKIITALVIYYAQNTHRYFDIHKLWMFIFEELDFRKYYLHDNSIFKALQAYFANDSLHFFRFTPTKDNFIYTWIFSIKNKYFVVANLLLMILLIFKQVRTNYKLHLFTLLTLALPISWIIFMPMHVITEGYMSTNLLFLNFNFLIISSFVIINSYFKKIKLVNVQKYLIYNEPIKFSHLIIVSIFTLVITTSFVTIYTHYGSTDYKLVRAVEHLKNDYAVMDQILYSKDKKIYEKSNILKNIAKISNVDLSKSSKNDQIAWNNQTMVHQKKFISYDSTDVNPFITGASIYFLNSNGLKIVDELYKVSPDKIKNYYHEEEHIKDYFSKACHLKWDWNWSDVRNKNLFKDCIVNNQKLKQNQQKIIDISNKHFKEFSEWLIDFFNLMSNNSGNHVFESYSHINSWTETSSGIWYHLKNSSVDELALLLFGNKANEAMKVFKKVLNIKTPEFIVEQSRFVKALKNMKFNYSLTEDEEDIVTKTINYFEKLTN